MKATLLLLVIKSFVHFPQCVTSCILRGLVYDKVDGYIYNFLDLTGEHCKKNNLAPPVGIEPMPPRFWCSALTTCI
jgi:hypothetical protein